MSAQRFSTGKQFSWQGRIYEVKRVLPEDRIRIEEVITGDISDVNLKELVDGLFSYDLWFELEGRQAKCVAPGQFSTENEYLDLANYPEHLVAIARERRRIIQPLLQMNPHDRTYGVVKDRVREIQIAYAREPKEGNLQISVSARSVYRWLRWYARSGEDLRSLVPQNYNRGGKGISRLNSEVVAIIESVIQDKAYRPENATIDDMLQEIALRIREENRYRTADEGLKMPSRGTVARRIEALDLAERFAAKHGSRAAKHEFAQFGQTEKPKLPLERVEIDHTKVDLIVVDDDLNLPLGRPWITFCLDVTTRYPLGFYLGFEPPSYYSVMECLFHAIRPKGNAKEAYGLKHEWQAFGIPVRLVIDNGKEFVGRDLTDACELLQIDLQGTPVRQPHFKGTIERYLRTLATQLFHTYPGTTFSNIQQKGDYDSVGKAVISLSDLKKAIYIWVVDVYAEKYHRGLNGVPARRWEESIRSGFSPRLPPNAQELFISLCRTDERIIQRYGIEFESLYYNCPDLAPLRARLKGKSVKIKFHPGDLSRVFAYDQFENRYIEVPAIAKEYAQNLSLWVHRAIRQKLLDEGRQVDLAGLGEAKRELHALAEQANKRKRGTRLRSARLDSSGRPPSLNEQEVLSSESFAEQVSPVAESTSSFDPALISGLDDQSLLAADERASDEFEIVHVRKTAKAKQ